MAALSTAFVSLLADPASKGKIRGAIESEVNSAAGSGAKAGEKAGASFASRFNQKSLAIAKNVSLIGVGVAAASVKMAADFQTATTRLVTAAGESESKIKAVSNGILDIAKSTGTTTSALTKGMYQIESAGFHGADGLKVLKAAAQGAKVEQADLGTVSNALTTVMEDLHAPTSDAAKIMSQLVATVGHGKLTMDELAGSIHSVLPNAAALKISLPEVAGALATMTAQGIGADQASQNLNHTIVKLAAPTVGMTKAMAGYGLSAADVAKNLGTGKTGLVGTFAELEKAALSNVPGMARLRSAFNQSTAAAHDAQRELTNLPPAAQKVAKSYNDGSLTLGKYRTELKGLPADQASLLQQWKSSRDGANGFSAALKSGGQDAQTFTAALKDMLGDQTGLQVALHLTGKASSTFNDNVKAIGASTAEAGGNVKDWSVVQETFNVKLAKLRETFQVLLIQIGTKLIPIFQSVIGVVARGVKFFQDHATAAKFLAGVIGGLLVTSIIRVAAAWVTANLAFATSPLGIILLLAAAFVTAYKKSQTFRDIVLGVFHYIKTGALDMAIGFEKYLLIPVLDVFSAIVHGAAAAFGWVPGIGGKLKKARSAFDDFRKGVDKSITGLEVTLKTENAKYEASKLQEQINKIKQGKVPGLTANNAAGKAKIAELQARIDKLLQKKPPVLTALNAAGKAKVAQLQSIINGMRQHRAPYLSLNTDAGRKLAKKLQDQIDAIRQGKVPDLTLTAHSANAVLDSIISKINNINTTPISPPAGDLPNIPGLPKKKKGSATGGGLPEGWSAVGELGAEMVYKRGSEVQVYSHGMSKAMVGGMGYPGFATGTPGAARDVVHTNYRGLVKSIVQDVKGGIPNARAAMHDLSRAMNDAFRLEGVSKKVDAAKARLTSLKQAAADLRSSVTDNLRQAFNAAAAGADPGSGYVAGLSNILGDFRKNTASTQKFSHELAVLNKLGLNKTYLAQLAQAGPSQTLDVLAKSNKSQIAQVNKAFSGYEGATAYAGTTAAHDVYSKAVASQQKVVNTLTRQARDLHHDISVLTKRVETLTHHTTEIVLDGKVIARSVSLANAKNARR